MEIAIIENKIRQYNPVNKLEELNAFANNEVDGALKVFSDTIVQFSGGIDTKSVFFSDASYGGDVIIAKRGFQKIEDLKGKKIAVEGINSFSHIWVLTVLERNGLKESDVHFVNLEAKDVPQALTSGEIDAGHIWEPFVSQALETGNHILITSKEVHGIIIDDLSFHSKIIEERPDDITRIIKALTRGVQFLKTNPQEAHDIISKELEMSIEDVEAFYQDAKIFGVEDNKQLMSKNAPNSIYDTAEIISNFLLERGQLPLIPNLDELIEPKFVNNIE